MKAVFAFDSTRDAYNASQSDEDAGKTGATLVVYSEQVVGLSWTWPVAITEVHGELHSIKPDAFGNIAKDAGFTHEQVREAVNVARRRGFDVRPDVLTWLN